MNAPPTLMTRLRARLGGEVPTEVLSAYRNAGARAYALLVEAEERRTALSSDAWSRDPATQAFFLCSWNAFVLQSLADEFVDTDYKADPGTVGFVPPVTAEQATAFYAEVEQWLVRAERAKLDPAFELDCYVPAELPEWVEVEPCPEPHLHAMLAASRKLAEHAELAVADAAAHAPEGRAGELAKLRAELVAVTTAGEYAQQLHVQFHRQKVDPTLHERIERSIKDALERAYLVGQLAAMPELISRPDVASRTERPKRLPGPGEQGFDPWCLTDEETRAAWKRDPAARRAVENLWSNDPDPARTLELKAEIDAAVARGDVVNATDAQGRDLGNYYCCPWSAIYAVRNPVRIGGQRLRPMQQFTLDVSAEELLEGGAFKRELVLGPFSPTSEVDYCDPAAGGHAG